MLKVLLVDDEPFILEGLSVIIDWKKEGFEIAGKAANAFEALEILKTENIDLVISDIKMPGMSGLELAQKVYGEKLSQAYFVILSGYNDFQNVRTALQNQCLDYMVKPVSEDDLRKVLSRVRQFHAASDKKRRDDFMVEREAFAKNMLRICRGRFRADDVDYVSRYLGDGKGFRYISVVLDEQDKDLRNQGGYKKRLLQKELYERCLTLFPGKEYLCILDPMLREQNYDVGIIYSEDMAKEQSRLSEQEYLEELRDRIKSSVDFSVVVIVGSRVERIEDIAESCREILLAYASRYFEMCADSEDSRKEALNKQMLDSLLSAVKTNDKEGIVSGSKAFWEATAFGRSDERMLRLGISYLMFGLLHMEEEPNEDISYNSMFWHTAEKELSHIDPESSEENLTRILLEYSDNLAKQRVNQSGGFLGQIVQDMAENYKENLSLKDYGKKYYVNSAYLGQSFKNKYGESFKDYLNRIRIDAAAEMLLFTDKKVYEIATEVGYKDLDYFINKFIAFKGCTPTKFRKRIK